MGAHETPFAEALRGRFFGLLTWEQLTRFWGRLDAGAGWYLYCVGEPPPAAPASAEETRKFVTEIDALLHREHHHDYCGIVYADDLDAPRIIKIYDPSHLGSSCGSGRNPPLPGWVMSLRAPADLAPTAPLPGNRRKWWQALWGRSP